MNSKKAQAPKPKTTPSSAMRDLAASLRDSITETDKSALEKDPEEAFIDLACRFVLALQNRGLTVVALPTREDQMQLQFDKAAGRMLGIFTEWMRKNPGASYDTRMSVSGKFQIILRTPEGTKVSFGGDVQDAYGQAAQAIQSYKNTP